MASNSRRQGFGPGVNSVGQRRSQPQSNFVRGGQQNANHPKPKDGYQTQQYSGPQGPQQNRQNQMQQQRPMQNAGQQQQRQQQGQQQQPQQHQQSQQHQQQTQQQPPQQQQQPLRPNMQENAQALLNQINQNQNQLGNNVQPKEEEVKPVVETPQAVPAPTQPAATTGEAAKEKPFWIKKTGRIPRAERVRRRNLRLKKVLQPKNALMVLNELVGNTAYTITESKSGYNQDVFSAALTIEGQTFSGIGKSKVAAKTAAAESAIKAIITKRLKNPGAYAAPPPMQSSNATSQNDEEKMEEERQENEDLSWSHIASFAIYKLLSSWDGDEGGNLIESFSVLNSSNALDGASRSSSMTNLNSAAEPKASKKLPDNAAQLNPCMLLNQMHPQAKYEEVSRIGNPPNVQFTISCTVEGQTFTGTGQNKKTARKYAAFEACKTLLKIEYPPDVYEPKVESMQVEEIPF